VLSLTYPLRLLLAIVGYLILYVLGNNVAWALRTPRSGRFGDAVEFVRLWGRKLWLGDVLRLAYYLVAPYLVLYWGWASPLDLGLADLDWIRGLGLTLALGAGSSLLLVSLWWQHVRLVGDQPIAQQAVWLEQPWGWAFALREAILLESWWALARSPMLLMAGPYFGVYLGLMAVFATGLLNARTRYELGVPGLREDVVLTASLAVVTATLYVFIHNLWLCIALHFALRLIILQLARQGMTREDSVGEQAAA
jgi:hypothetical protein